MRCAVNGQSLGKRCDVNSHNASHDHQRQVQNTQNLFVVIVVIKANKQNCDHKCQMNGFLRNAGYCAEKRSVHLKQYKQDAQYKFQTFDDF